MLPERLPGGGGLPRPRRSPPAYAVMCKDISALRRRERPRSKSACAFSSVWAKLVTRRREPERERSSREFEED